MNELPHRAPRRVQPVHECFHQANTRRRARVEHRLCLRDVHRDRLLAQHVFAGLGGGHRPLRVKVVRQRNVDGVDVGIVQEVLVGPYAFSIPNRPAVALARPASRDAIATTLHRSAFMMPGMTLGTAILAGRGSPAKDHAFAPRAPPPNAARSSRRGSLSARTGPADDEEPSGCADSLLSGATRCRGRDDSTPPHPPTMRSCTA